MSEVDNNLTWHAHHVTKHARKKFHKQYPAIIWLTGLSGSGKSSIANALDVLLFEANHNTFLLDGDNVRQGLNKDLGFSDADRVENIRRIGEVSKLFCDSGALVITAFISPFIEDRALVRALVEKDEFVEVFVDTSLEVCENRDPKGLYKKARSGEIPNFSGISSPYEAPKNAEIVVKTENKTEQECAQEIVDYLRKEGYLDA